MNLDDIRRTLRLGMGPCQGGFCTYRADGHPPRASATPTPSAPTTLLLHVPPAPLEGLEPILYGDQMRQAWLDDWIFQGTLDVEHLPRGGARVAARVAGMSRRVVVVGAGLAGLAAAMRLAQRGARVPWSPRASASLHLVARRRSTSSATRPSGSTTPRDALAAFTAAQPRAPVRRASRPSARRRRSTGSASGAAGMRLPGRPRGATCCCPTAVGVPRPDRARAGDDGRGRPARRARRSWSSGLRALKDFFPPLLADNLRGPRCPAARAVEARPLELALSPRPGRADVRGAGLRARARRPGVPRRGSPRAAAAARARRARRPARGARPARRAARPGASCSERSARRCSRSRPCRRRCRACACSAMLLGALRAAGGRMRAGRRGGRRRGRGGRVSARRWSSDAVRERALPRRRGRARHGRLRVRRASSSTRTGRCARPSSACRWPARPRASRASARATSTDQPLMRAGSRSTTRLRPVDAGRPPVWENLHAAGAIVAGAAPVAREVRRGHRHRGRLPRGGRDPGGTSLMIDELMRDSLDHCVKCTICETYCPVAAATPLFPGPKYVGPQAERYRGAGAVARRVGRLLLGLRHLHPGLPAGREDRRDQLPGPRGAQGGARHPAARPADRAPDAGRAPRDAGRAARQLDACATRRRARARWSGRSASTATRPCPRLAGRTLPALGSRAPPAAGPARAQRRSSTSTAAAPTTTSPTPARDGRRGARAQRVRRDRARAGLLRPAAAVQRQLPTTRAATCAGWPRSLAPYARDGHDIVATSTSCGLMLKREAREILGVEDDDLARGRRAPLRHLRVPA